MCAKVDLINLKMLFCTLPEVLTDVRSGAIVVSEF